MRFLLFFLFPVWLSAQTENQVLDRDLCSVQLFLSGAPLSLPLMDLKAGPGTLVLQFDHLGDELKDYKYTLTHCNSDWKPSELDANEYIDGFTEDRITSVQNAFNTLTQYTHYELALPNRNMRCVRSGNIYFMFLMPTRMIA